MDLELSEEEAELRDNVRSVLTSICPPSVVRAVYEGKGAPTEVWEKMVELYWPALAIDEAHGGLGMGFLEVALVAEELGRATVPSPFLATVTQYAPAIRELGGADRLLPALAAGEVTGALAHDGVVTARRDGDSWILDGEVGPVLDGASADHVVVVADSEAGRGAFVVGGGEVEATPRHVLDPTMPIADLRLTGVAVPADRVLAEPGAPGVVEGLQRAVEEATVALATATAGTCRKIFEDTLAYAKDREQYGRPIGSFQALKHRLADMYLSVERATALCYFAALTIAEDTPDRATATSAAKAGAGDCQRLLAQEGLQLHGGIGFTWEHDLHFLLKRAKTGDALLGDAVHHRARLAELLGVAA
jgi:alkylation response protein AidB-like acyl-CoA dehydrogenase